MSNNVTPHPTSVLAKDDRLKDRENLARQLRTTQMMREAAREQINPTEVISELIEIDMALQGEKDAAGNSIPLEREIISALKARAEIKFKLLGKVLPDLKATESVSHNVHDHAHVHSHQVSNVEIAQRLQLWRQQQGIIPAKDAPQPRGKDKESCVEATFTEVPDEEYDFL